MVTAKSNIANAILQISSRFVTRTGQLLSKIVRSSSLPPVIPRSISAATDRLLRTSISLVNSTDHSLANVINATSGILARAVDDQSQFVTRMLNSTARLVNSTTDSLESLLNTTNHLVAGVIQSRVNASNAILNDTSNLLSASSQAISSFLNATTLIINNSPNDPLTRDDGPSTSLSALETAQNALSTVFHKTSDLLRGVLTAEHNIKLRLVNATEALLNASFQIKATLVNATRDLTNNATNSIVHLVQSSLQPPLPPSPPQNEQNAPIADSTDILSDSPIIDTPTIVDDSIFENPSSAVENTNLLEKDSVSGEENFNAPTED